MLKYPIVGWMIVLFFQHRHEDLSKGRKEAKTGLGNATSISHTYSLAKKRIFQGIGFLLHANVPISPANYLFRYCCFGWEG